MRSWLTAISLLVAATFPEPATSPLLTGAGGTLPSGIGLFRTGAQYTEAGSTIQSMFIGVKAGAAYPLSAETKGYGSVGVGAGALQSVTAMNAEDVALGLWAGQYVTTGDLDTAVGMHALGADQAATAVTAIGTDALKAAVSVGGIQYATAIGDRAMNDGAPRVGATAVGALAMQGSSNALVLEGSPNGKGTIIVTITGHMAGLPVVVVARENGSNALAQVATGLYQDIQSAVRGVTAPSYTLQVQNGPILYPDGAYVIAFSFPGTCTSGVDVCVTPKVVGDEGLVVRSTGGAYEIQNTAIGTNAMLGLAMTNAGYNSLTGTDAARFITSGSGNSGTGWGVLGSLMSGDDNTAVGAASGSKIVTGKSNTIIGARVGSRTLKSGHGNILVGTDDRVDTPEPDSSDEINIGGLLFWNTNSVAAPTPTSCGRSPGIDAHANNRSGTVTVGSGSVPSCTIRFAGAGYTRWSHCRITSQSADPSFSYTYTLTTMTLSGANLASHKIDYDCDGF